MRARHLCLKLRGFRTSHRQEQPVSLSTTQPRIDWSAPEHSDALSALYRTAWRNAYAGIIPGAALEAMIARRSAAWWLDRVGRARVLSFEDTVAGYATLGPGRRYTARRFGEIYEIYLSPEFQGVSFGRRLFDDARACLRTAGFRRLSVWCLDANANGCRFYRAMGGDEVARGVDIIGGTRLVKLRFAWN